MRTYVKLDSIRDRKSTRLNSSHANISYAVFCLEKKRTKGKGYMLKGKGKRGKLKLFFFNDTATTEIYTLSLHDALPILPFVPGTTSELHDLPITTVSPGLNFRAGIFSPVPSTAGHENVREARFN